jgi:hypothetical protein
MVGRVTPVSAKRTEDILRVIFRRRALVSQVIRQVIFLVCHFLLGMVAKSPPVKGRTGTFKPLVTLGNLVFSIALVCRFV